MSPPVLAAYTYCEAVTGSQARNFSYGIRLLPPGKRRAMSALYAFSRRIDDIGDGPLGVAAKEARLAEARAVLTRVRGGGVSEDDTDPVAVALGHAARSYPIPLEALDELIDGVLMDVHGRRYETWEELREYCRCVAGTVGRLSLGVFGTAAGLGAGARGGARESARAAQYADTLGLALQLTNILRDVREDAGRGRTYLPTEDLDTFGCSGGFSTDSPPPGADFAGLIHFEVRRARTLFDEGYTLLPMLDRRSGACVAAMAGIYHRLLDRIAHDPLAVLRGRVSLPSREKAYVALRGLVGSDSRQAARNARRALTLRSGA
ncbi:presqualene diphosphate synthase HpnD [Streptomyces sp. RKND-216]|uniref:presqualene diphosphate synthase HpnD n=1 Tax=Streptomyces sp. RKND-216 TaxID=2562581 RepID=UPI00109DED4F|nr:presqualene diphosphate synthase HpnD [Streptomyces sp. RKND-216]THA27455.1 presqualene diphosphate synthase HpnD [Streptomyces sp. RKND-216]